MSITFNPPTIYEYQTPLVINQAAPVQNTWYYFTTGGVSLTEDPIINAKIYAIGVNIEDTGEDIELVMNIDGETISMTALGLAHSTPYFADTSVRPIGRTDILYLETDENKARIILEGKSISIGIRKTTAAGAGNLTGIVTWGQLKTV